MIIRSFARRSNLVQSLASTPARCTIPPSARLIHTVPRLGREEELNQNGIPGLLSKNGFKTAWVDYMEHILGELNGITHGTQLENKPTQDLVIEWARRPEWAHAFNAASMAFNNHFFFEGIATNPEVRSQPSRLLTERLVESFGSIETLRAEFLATALAMFGPGFLWLVQVTEKNDTASGAFRILPTYIAGSPLSGAHYRRQSEDLNTHNPSSYEVINPVGSFGKASQKEPKVKKPLGGVDITPLMCVNTWEHVWLGDYGIKGKTKYLENWWEKIDWNKVEAKVSFERSYEFKTGAKSLHKFERSV
ncbi:manganese and iron superoxide dismutase [Lojkania enalia]|uniref:Manganese and iron superoxide dismutase n=1 Tax=Lojkania enalia TaxID=147567 RepID=A0A9P4KG99_9PLEO|nr:manganese and iron superoxide dismutase [Didymosphaeria enalia]